MAKRESRRSEDGCGLDMTPMIDVVFQLIIFFIVTFKINDQINEEIVLEDGKHGPIITESQVAPLIIEVARNGRISINNMPFSEAKLNGIINERVKRMGYNFPVMVRADKLAQHAKVRKVMDICTSNGIWKMSFVAVKDRKNNI